MATTRIHSAAFFGLDILPIVVEVDVITEVEKLGFVIVGLPDTGVRESKDRVLTALRNSHLFQNNLHCTINLAPGDLKKEGPLYDLPIALGILASLKKMPHPPYMIVGELSLNGELRPIPGALSITSYAQSKGMKGVILPLENVSEAALVPNIDVIGVKTLAQAWDFLQNPNKIPVLEKPSQQPRQQESISSIDFADIKGQKHVKRALEIAAAGGHNLVMCGPPGAGKTMLAKAITSILPPLSVEEALEVTKIHSIAGCSSPKFSLMAVRPFRSPHHTISYAGLIGGGANPRPGEVSLAHRGVLFLDELPEFSRHVLEVLRQPLEDGKVTISRALGNYTFPTQFMCIAAMNPCPCGYLGHPTKPCKDTGPQVEKYRGKVSGPLWDRFDMHIDVPALKQEDLLHPFQEESSTKVKERVVKARLTQTRRFGSSQTNALMDSRLVKQHCSLDVSSQNLLSQAVQTMGLSARSFHRILKVALTIADLSGSASIEKEHLMEALSFRGLA